MLKRAFSRLGRKIGIQKGVNWCLKKLNYSRKININGIAIIIPSIYGITFSPSEPWMIHLLGKVFREQHGVFLDVGVNKGQSLVNVRVVEQHRKYIGFEPNPVCIFYVQELIKKNRFENCTIVPIGLFTEDCLLSLNLFHDDTTDSSASLFGDFRRNKTHSKVSVPVYRFASVANLVNDERVCIVKIDVEGAELEVVKSLLGLILHDRPLILIEILPVYSEKNAFRKTRQEELEQIFADANYVTHRVEKTSTNGYSGLRLIDKIGIHSDLTQCDYVIIPDEKRTQFRTWID